MSDESPEVRIVRLEERGNAMREALSLARTELNRRLEEMNAFRAQIQGERKEFLTLSAYESKHEILRGRIEKLEKKDSNMDGRLWMLGAGLTALVVLINLLFKYWGK